MLPTSRVAEQADVTSVAATVAVAGRRDLPINATVYAAHDGPTGRTAARRTCSMAGGQAPSGR
ncbi:hypothetical protein [Streptomyces curacoi]|uniref:hypothetical protein n=1 Tax=Streptomyces curacoi TaxID=146536 RepID=UPI00131B7CF0|nr:hypothetical protein [Streptomyces curacoi]